MCNITRFFLAVLAAICSGDVTSAVAQIQSASQVQATALLASRELEPIGKDPVVVAAVRKHNERKLPMALIQRADREWTEANHTTSAMKEIAGHPVAKHLASVAPKSRGIAQVLLMGGVGELVAFTGPVPSDYYQGDEPKWQRTVKQSKLFVDRMTRDESTGSVIVHISIPVVEGNATIGVITFGIDVARYR